jgi:FCP1-like phosphatase family protein
MMLSNMCAVCGKILDEEYDTKDFSSLTMTGGTVLRVSTNEALSIQQNQTAVLQQSRRLALVLDIDNTLVHATYAKGRAPATHRQHENSKDIYHLSLEETGMDGTRRHLVIKKRPHLDLFLREMHSAFQMTIYTAGTKRYAEAVTRVIDPHGTYIGSRIVARSEDGVTGVHDKSLEKIFLKDSSMAVILDDREDVWRGPQSEQLLVVRPYEFFHPGNEASIAVQACTEMGYVNNAPGMATGAAPPPSSSAGPLVPVIVLQQPRPGMAIGLAQRTSTQYTEADDQLLRCIDLLRSLHQHYYARIDQHQQQQLQAAPSPSSSSTHTTLSSNSPGLLKPTVAELLRQHRSLILRSCVVAIASDPQMPAHLKHDFSHRMRHLARSLGATVVFDLHPRTTHVIALTDNCPLVRDAVAHRAQDVWVLHVDWLHHCRWALAKAEESTFMLRPPAPGAPFPQPKYESSSSPALLPPTASTAAPPTQTGFRAASDGMAMEAAEEREGASGANNGKRKRTHADTHPASAVSTTHITAAADEKEGIDAINSASATSENGAESEQAHLLKRRKTVSIVETVEGNGDRSASVGRRALKGGVADNFDSDDDDDDDKVLREVKRSARLQRLAQERRRQHRMRKAHRDSGDTAAILEEDGGGGGGGDEYEGDELFQLDSGMRCGVGEEDEGDGDEDEDDEEGGGVEKMQDDTAASTISKAQKRLLRRPVGTRNATKAKTNEDEELVEDEEEDDDEEVNSDDENGNDSDDSDVNHLNHHMNGSNNIDESERVRYLKLGSNSFQNDADEDEEDGYFVQSGDDENEDAEEEDEDEEEMALVQKLRSRTAQYPSHLQQDQQPMSDSDSEGFATLQHYGGRSISNSSAALSGMDSYPNSIPASPFAGTTGPTGAAATSSFENTLTEKVLASIAPGPVVDMDEEEESFMQS